MTTNEHYGTSKKNGRIVYEDKFVYAVLPENPATAGHLVVLPKGKATIVEQVPDFVMQHLFVVANKLSVAVFDALKAEGSNIIIQNGLSAGQLTNQMSLHIIPRRQNDGLDFAWRPQQLDEAQLDGLESQLLSETGVIGNFETEGDLTKEVSSTGELGDHEKHLLDAFERLP